VNGAGWFVLGALFMAVLIFVGERILAWRQDRIDRHNIETMAKIKERMFNDPFPFGIPVVECDLVPDDKIYVLNTNHLYLDGKPTDPSEFVMSPKTKARIKNLKEQ
jgi:hypothetical protein